MLLELLSGIATDLECSPFSVLTKICGRWQTPQKFLNPTQNSVDVMPVGSQNSNKSQKCMDGTAVRTDELGPTVGPKLSDRTKQIDLSVHLVLGPRVRPSAPCDIEAETNMILSEIKGRCQNL